MAQEGPLAAVPFNEAKNRILSVKKLFTSDAQTHITNDNIELVVTDRPTPGAGEALIRIHYVSIDPTHRLWFTDKSQYLAPVTKDSPMRAATLGKVEASNDPKLPVGAWVTGFLGIQDYAVASSAAGVSVVPEIPGKPITAHLSVLSLIIGLAAWVGTKDIIAPKPGEVVVISAAAGAVGSLAGQLAKLAGAKVIGVVGSDAKAKWITQELGFDGAINYKTENVRDKLKELAPDGVNGYFENVGGDVTEAVILSLRNFARVAMCGTISTYNSGKAAGLRNYENILHRRVKLQGFICVDHVAKMPEVTSQLQKLVTEGKVKYLEDVKEGIENYASVVNLLFSGRNEGKLILKL